MKSGRMPVPVQLRIVQGGRATKLMKAMKKPLPPHVPPPSTLAPVKPRTLSEGAAKQWDFVCGLIDEMGLLSRTDTISIQLLCEAYADYIAAIAAIKKNGGETYRTQTSRGKGVIIRNIPAVRQRNDADYRIRSWMSEFGMTPAARSRVRGSGKGGEDDPAEKYFGQG